MATAAKKSLPELTVSKGKIVDAAKAASQYRSTAAEATAQEKTMKDLVAEESGGLRIAEESKGKYIGKVVVTGEDFPPVRTEFRMDKGALDLAEEENLNRLLGTIRPLLFGKEQVVTAITDPAGLIDELTAQGKNPWDFLEVSVKKGLDRALTGTKSVVMDEALLPKDGFLNTLNDVEHALSPDAKAWLHEFLLKALKATVVMGTKEK